MEGYVTDIEEATKGNENFREVLFTAEHLQIVVMTLKPGEEIGMEVHDDVDQFLRVEQGEGTIILDGREQRFQEADAAVVPAGTAHNVVNGSTEKPLKLYTLYAPPKHAPGTVHPTRADAEAEEEHEARPQKAAGKT